MTNTNPKPKMVFLDLSCIPLIAIKDVARNMGWLEEEKQPLAPYLEKMQMLSEHEFMDKWLTWHGIINWTSTIMSVMNCVNQAAESAKSFPREKPE